MAALLRAAQIRQRDASQIPMTQGPPVGRARLRNNLSMSAERFSVPSQNARATPQHCRADGPWTRHHPSLIPTSPTDLMSTSWTPLLGALLGLITFRARSTRSEEHTS